MQRSPARALVTPGLVAFLLVALPACKSKAEPEKAPPATSGTAAPASFAVGDKVDVKWNGTFWKGEVLEVKGAKFRVHYTGWPPSFDEDVTADRLRPLTDTSKVGTEDRGAAADAGAPSAASSGLPTTGAFKAGDKVDIEWSGKQWQGHIISVTATGQLKVHYDGWPARYDETVPASRVRAPTGTAKRGGATAD